MSPLREHGARAAWWISLLCCCVSAGAAQSVPEALRGVDRQFAALESAELRESDTRYFIPPDRETLAGAQHRVAAYLATHPDDAAALVLLARVDRFALQRHRSARCTSGCVLDSAYDDAPVHAALDRALTLQPDDAAAHFWKARLYADGRPALHDGEFAIDVDTAQVLVHGRRAIALDPGRLRYREFLAVFLADATRYAEARTVIEGSDEGRHPLARIFRDLDALPVPAGAIPWPGAAALYTVGMDEAPPRFTAQTGRAWIVLMDPAALAAFYGSRWPGAHLFAGARADDGTVTSWFQLFRADRRGALQPEADSARVLRMIEAHRLDGVLLMVRVAGPAVDGPERGLPAAAAGHDTFLELVVLTGVGR